MFHAEKMLVSEKTLILGKGIVPQKEHCFLQKQVCLGLGNCDDDDDDDN